MAVDDRARVVEVAHDYQCPWCWFSLFQAQRLVQEFPELRLNWVGYELLPTSADWPEKRPEPSQRLVELARIDNIPMPKAWPTIVSSHLALEGAEYMKRYHPKGFDGYNEAVYRAFWERSEDISNIELVSDIASQFGANSADFKDIIEQQALSGAIIPFREPANSAGITHVTTFRFHGEQCAEAPYSTIQDLAKRFCIWYG